jgi:hypothetical protein
LFESIFGKMNLFFKMILFYGFCSAFSLLMILINTASSVSFEAKKSYKLLNKLFITFNKQISIRMRIKVWIQTIFFSFHINYTLFLISKYSDSCYHLLRESLRERLDFIVGKYLFSTIFVFLKWGIKNFQIYFFSNNLTAIFFTSDIDNDCGLFSQDYRNVYSQQKLILE